MASTISAGTTSGTALNMAGDTTGNLAFQTQAGANTITVPNATGTMMVSGNMPAFSAYANAGTVTTTGANTKILFQVEEFDTNNNFASSRFTPTVAGYYQLNAMVFWGTAQTTRNQIQIWKNGSLINTGLGSDFLNGNNYSSLVSTVGYANGTTDYFEVYVYQQTGGNYTTSTAYTNFTGVLVRAA